MNNKIDKLQNIINDNLELVNEYLFQRKRKIKFCDIFYYLSQLVSNHKNSSTIVSSSMDIDNLCDASNSAFIKKRKQIPSIVFNLLSVDLLDFSYEIKNNLLFNKYRVLATDGTHISLSKELSKENYKTTKKKYVDALVNRLYDIYNDSIIDLHLSNTKNERKSLVSSTFFQNINQTCGLFDI